MSKGTCNTLREPLGFGTWFVVETEDSKDDDCRQKSENLAACHEGLKTIFL